MFDSCLTVSELPSGPRSEIGRRSEVGLYASRFVSPCEHFSCPNVTRCKIERLACNSFKHFVYTHAGCVLQAPTEPSRKIYERIFSGKEDE